MMRLAARLCLLATLVLLVVSIAAWANLRAISTVLRSEAFLLPAGTETLVAGDSHAEVSFDPDLLKGTVNISKSGEGLFFTYYKLRHFVERNPGIICKVILAFSYHNLSKKYQEEYIFGRVNSAYALEHYYKYLDDAGKRVIATNENYLIYQLKYEYGLPMAQYKERLLNKALLGARVDRKNIEESGGFRRLDNAAIDPIKVKAKIDKYFYDSNVYTGTSQIMVDALDNIARLCQSEGIMLYLFNAPLHETYRMLVPDEAIVDYNKAVKELIKKYKNIVIVDTSQNSYGDELFADGDHLNQKGATTLSQEISNYMAELYVQ